MECCGTLRISNPKTLQNWFDKGWFQKKIAEGYIFSTGCGRFKTEVCTCSACRTRTRPELQKVILLNTKQ